MRGISITISVLTTYAVTMMSLFLKVQLYQVICCSHLPICVSCLSSLHGVSQFGMHRVRDV